ncbi:transposase, partial [Falsiroseomonas sp. HW251]|uniref:transposase n=1 Tax=Falsiroseomonas sp. HW251 TaxID=3390998 RepID=UPI003D31960B
MPDRARALRGRLRRERAGQGTASARPVLVCAPSTDRTAQERFGMRLRMVKDQRYRSAYIVGAVCPARDTGAALVLTYVSMAAMNLLLEEVASQLPRGTHAAMLIDNAGWHVANELRVPTKISFVHLRPYSPELNVIEKVWQYLRGRYLSGRLFASTRAIVDACYTAWNRPHPLADGFRL